MAILLEKFGWEIEEIVDGTIFIGVEDPAEYKELVRDYKVCKEIMCGEYGGKKPKQSRIYRVTVVGVGDTPIIAQAFRAAKIAAEKYNKSTEIIYHTTRGNLSTTYLPNGKWN